MAIFLNLRCKAHGRIFPYRRVKAAGYLPETLDTLFEWDKQRGSSAKKKVSLGPGVAEGSDRKAFRQHVSGEGGDQAICFFTSSRE